MNTANYLCKTTSAALSLAGLLQSNLSWADDKGNERTDGIATQFFVGDVGGQVWHFIMDNGELKNIKGGGKNNSGVLADLGGADNNHGENARRFYHGSDVAAEGKKLFVNIGSGYAILSKNQGALGDPNAICFEGKCRVQFGRGEFSDPFSRQAEIGRKTYWIDLAQ